MDAEELVKAGYLQKVSPAPDLADKEFTEADYDLKRARAELEGEDCKWAIVKAYYAVFHSAKGVLYLLGYREKAHFAVGQMLELLSKEGKLEGSFVADFKAALSARQGADYHYDYSETLAREMVDLAEGFVARMKKLRKEMKG